MKTKKKAIKKARINYKIRVALTQIKTLVSILLKIIITTT